jgi:hypothetical protein
MNIRKINLTPMDSITIFANITSQATNDIAKDNALVDNRVTIFPDLDFQK